MKYDFYILIEGGLCSFGNGSLSFNNIIKIKADDFIPYFEKCKKDFNSKLEKIFKSHE